MNKANLGPAALTANKVVGERVSEVSGYAEGGVNVALAGARTLLHTPGTLLEHSVGAVLDVGEVVANRLGAIGSDTADLYNATRLAQKIEAYPEIAGPAYAALSECSPAEFAECAAFLGQFGNFDLSGFGGADEESAKAAEQIIKAAEEGKNALLAKAEAEKKAAEAKATADKLAAEAKVKADTEAAEAKAKADKEVAEAKVKADKEAEITKAQEAKENLEKVTAAAQEAVATPVKAVEANGQGATVIDVETTPVEVTA